MRRSFLVLLLCGCATTGTQPAQMTTQQPVLFQGDQGSLLGDAALSSGSVVAAPPAAVWLAVKKVYADMEVPVTLEDPARHEMGNKNFYRSRKFAGQPMAQLVNCGTSMTGPKAATFRIYISSITTVAPDGKGGSNVQTIFIPYGQDVEGTSSDRIPCGSTGRFELLFLKRVASEVGK